MATALLLHLVVCREARKKSAFLYSPLQLTQRHSVRGLGTAEQESEFVGFWTQPLLSADGDMWLLQLHTAYHTGQRQQ